MMTLGEWGSVKAERLALPTCTESDSGVSQAAGLQRANNPVVWKVGQEKNVC